MNYTFYMFLYSMRVFFVVTGVYAHLAEQPGFNMWLFFGKMYGFELFVETGWRAYMRWIHKEPEG